MKKIFSFILALMVSINMFAGDVVTTNYAGSSKFTDNIDLTAQFGGFTTMNSFCAGHTALAPVIVLGIDKYVNPWFGVEVEGRALIGTGTVNEARFNSHTAIDAVNVSGYAKFNIVNMFAFNGTRHFFEPVAYTGLGWGHYTCGCVPNTNIEGVHTTATHNCTTYRAGMEWNFNITPAFGIVLNTSAVWGDVCNGRLAKYNGSVEATIGAKWYLKTSNGTRTFAKNNMVEINKMINDLRAENEMLKNRKPEVVIREVVKEVPAAKSSDATYAVSFAQNSSDLTDAAKAILDNVPTNSSVNIAGSTSPEGTVERNTALAVERAQSVADYLKNRGVTVNTVSGGESGRVAVITVNK